MANVKTLGLVLLIGALTAFLVVRQTGLVHKNELEVEDFQNHHSNHSNHWGAWKSKHGFKFGAHEESFRQSLFNKTSKWVEEHNARKNKTYEVEVNQFAAYSDEEFSALYLGYNNIPTAEESVEFNGDIEFAASSVDWTSKGAVTGVKNQGSCGSCWAFSAVAALESLNKIKNGKLTTFSEQQLVDCSSSYGNNGCGGGGPIPAFKYVIDKGIAESSAYPYTAKQGACKTNGGKFKISGYTSIPKGNTAQMMAAMEKVPVTLGVQADNAVFRNYKSGILNNAACGTSTNHAVLGVGYVSGQYWKIKNSWGTGWGQGGYVQIAMTSGDGICGVNKTPIYPN